jgi:predicted DNA-binding transcriptional regulator AlpA
MSIKLDRREYPERLIPENEAAELLGVATGTLANWRCTGRGPRYVRVGTRTIRYPREALEEFLNGELRELEPGEELSDQDLIKTIARLANRLVRRQRQAAAA